MVLNLTYYYSGAYPYFVLSDTITLEELEELFGILSMMLEKKKPFVFLLDARGVKEFPTFKAGYFILNWMKAHYSIIPNVLLGSSIIIDNSIIINILNWVFTHQKPVSPNIVTKDITKGKIFIKQFIPNILDKKNIVSIVKDVNQQKESRKTQTKA